MKPLMATSAVVLFVTGTLGGISQRANALTAAETFGIILGIGAAAAAGAALSEEDDDAANNLNTQAEYDRGYQDGLSDARYNNRNHTTQYDEGYYDGIDAGHAQSDRYDNYYTGGYRNNRTITCYFNDQLQACNFRAEFAESGVGIQITFPDGFSRNLFYDNQNFYDDSAPNLQVTQDARYFYISNENNEYFEIPKGFLQ